MSENENQSIDERVRNQATGFFVNNAKWIVAVAVVAVAGWGGSEFYKSQQLKKEGQIRDQLYETIGQMEKAEDDFLNTEADGKSKKSAKTPEKTKQVFESRLAEPAGRLETQIINRIQHF